jgi:predicted phosphodiesterase
MAKKRGPASRVLVTGDIAYSGTRAQYETAVPWLEELTKAAGCAPQELSCIPGNHDCDLSVLTNQAKLTYEHLRGLRRAEATTNFHAIVEDGEIGSPFLPKLTAYRAFANGFGCDFESAKRPAWTRLFELPNGVKLRFHGLTSVQVSNLDDDANSLFLGNRQYTITEDPNVVNIVLCHHPLDWFVDEDEAKRYFKKRARVLMFGHEHKANAEVISDVFAGTETLVLSAAATNPPDADYDYAYNWIEFSCLQDAGKYFLAVDIFPRVWFRTRVRFDVDRSLLPRSGESVRVRVHCPNVEFILPAGEPVKTETVAAAPVAINVGAPPTGGSTTAEQGGLPMDAKSADFDKLRYIFWRYLNWKQRLEVLVKAKALPDTADEPIPQTMERKALEQAAASPGKLHDIWDAVMQLVPPDKRQDNPFSSNL